MATLGIDWIGKEGGGWGCVSVMKRDYQFTEFSCVSFVRQNAQMQATSLSLEKREQMGEKAWLNQGLPFVIPRGPEQ